MLNEKIKHRIELLKQKEKEFQNALMSIRGGSLELENLLIEEEE
jgi:hypothetical protein